MQNDNADFFTYLDGSNVYMGTLDEKSRDRSNHFAPRDSKCSEKTLRVRFLLNYSIKTELADNFNNLLGQCLPNST